MSQRVQYHETMPFELYAVGHPFGDSYDGPGCGYLFEGGRITEPVPAERIRQHPGFAAGAVFFAWDDSCELIWNGAEWLYEPMPEPAAELVAAPVNARQRCAAKTAAGKPCRRWASHGSELCASHG